MLAEVMVASSGISLEAVNFFGAPITVLMSYATEGMGVCACVHVHVHIYVCYGVHLCVCVMVCT